MPRWSPITFFKIRHFSTGIRKKKPPRNARAQNMSCLGMPGVFFQYNTDQERIYWENGAQLHASLFAPVLAYLECLFNECNLVTVDPTAKSPRYTFPSCDYFMKRIGFINTLTHRHTQTDKNKWRHSKNALPWLSSNYTEKPCLCHNCQNSYLTQGTYGIWTTNCVDRYCLDDVRCQHL